MKKQLENTKIYSTDTQKKAVADHPSDGSELIPAEVQVHLRTDELNAPLATGYTVDDEGITNNYATEPAMYPAEYPTPKQQRSYIVQAAAAMVLVTVIVLIAFTVS